MMNATQGQAEAVTVVFWDIMTYPVPSGCDAGVVGQCITRYLRQLGYCGPLSIIAVGLLTDVNQDVLRAVSSTGIVLNHVLLGSIGILRSMDTWKQTRRPPANMMLISSDESIIPRIRHSSGYNIFRLFPDESLWLEFFLQDSDTLKEDKCSVTSASDLWICSVCTDHLVSQGYEKFTTHLYSEEHQIKANRVEVEAMAQTSVIWDIKGCPVPPGCDARRVRSCIEEYLNDFGYFGPLTITAVGLLTDVNQDVLRAVSSTGIILRHMDVNKSGDISSVMYLHPRSPTIMVICPYSELSAKVVGDLLDLDYNMIELFPYNSPYSESLWKKFLLEGVCFSSVCSERSEYASWVCSVFHDISGNGFDDFITHIFSPEHIPEEYDEDDDAVTVFWDINGYPVPSVCDPRLVRQCIEEYLKDCGYNGPFTINAIGRLTEVPPDVLEALSSTGIILRNILCDPADIMYRWASANPSPANLMVICPYSTKVRSKKYGIIVPFRHESSDPDSDSDCPWEHFLLSYSEKETFEEEEEYNCYTAPAQPQQWNPAYGQQAAYGAYGGYPPGSTASAQPQQWNHAYGQQASYGAYGGYPPGSTASAQPQQWNHAYGQQAAYGAYGGYPPGSAASAQPQQWNHAYGQQAAYGAYRGYPPGSAASAQPQQWNHAYGQQAAYHSYGGYPTGYTAPQAPAPVPHAAAYGAYPAQTYPTQSYAPPFVTVAPVVAHVQQPITAAAPQSYYNTYY